jgi:hypothetical protein
MWPLQGLLWWSLRLGSHRSSRVLLPAWLLLRLLPLLLLLMLSTLALATRPGLTSGPIACLLPAKLHIGQGCHKPC